MEICNSTDDTAFQQGTNQILSNLLLVNDGISNLKNLYDSLIKERDELKEKVHELELQNERLLLNNTELVKIIEVLQNRISENSSPPKASESGKVAVVQVTDLADQTLISETNSDGVFPPISNEVCAQAVAQEVFTESNTNDTCGDQVVSSSPTAISQFAQDDTIVDNLPRQNMISYTCETAISPASDQDEPQKYKLLQSTEILLCGICDTSFPSELELERHCRMHKGEKPYKCGECGHCFTLRGSLKRHIQAHSGKKPFACGTCGAHFTRLHNLKRHQVLHSQSTLYKCDYCARKYQTSAELDKHLMTHSEDKKYACDICGRGFTAQSSLSTHKRTHSGERPYQCKLCNQSFNQMVGLQKHMTTHNKAMFPCQQCHQVFSTSEAAQKHSEMHSVKE